MHAQEVEKLFGILFVLADVELQLSAAYGEARGTEPRLQPFGLVVA